MCNLSKSVHFPHPVLMCNIGKSVHFLHGGTVRCPDDFFRKGIFERVFLRHVFLWKFIILFLFRLIRKMFDPKDHYSEKLRHYSDQLFLRYTFSQKGFLGLLFRKSFSPIGFYSYRFLFRKANVPIFGISAYQSKHFRGNNRSEKSFQDNGLSEQQVIGLGLGLVSACLESTIIVAIHIKRYGIGLHDRRGLAAPIDKKTNFGLEFNVETHVKN